MEKRWGDEWTPGMRVRMPDNQSPTNEVRDGVIRRRSWGRERRKPIWNFEVLFDGDEAVRVYGPNHMASAVEEARKAGG
ncbi:hypothetical protein OG233_14065 [Streptomyces sp. NBC_01218]|uniref:hypothetical protein n=1 Tax=Streptomyces sp. NBC_01218 TaxID=2903780 RepID=UPI002E13B182|nr:hypothetical protein OG233_14065 [Streptomyces sp. NBC_01218]